MERYSCQQVVVIIGKRGGTVVGIGDLYKVVVGIIFVLRDFAERFGYSNNIVVVV